MSQPERIITKRVDMVEELACVRSELSEAYTGMLRSMTTTARTIARIDELIIAVAPRGFARAEPERPAERPAPAVQAATPAGYSPAAQDEGRTVEGRKAPDEAPERDRGKADIAGQSGECRHEAGAGGESAASADTAPAPDVEKVIPRVPRVEEPTVRTHDRVLDHYAEHGRSPLDTALALGLSAGSVSAYLSKARTSGDPRAEAGDRKRGVFDVLKREPAPSPAAAQPVARPTPPAVAPAPVSKPAPPHSAAAPPAPAEPIMKPAPATPAASPRLSSFSAPDGLLIRVKSMDGEVHGPGGIWRTTEIMAKAAGAISDGDLYGTERMARLAGIPSEKGLVDLIPMMQAGLRKIGIDLVHTKGIGCKLNVIGAGAA